MYDAGDLNIDKDVGMQVVIKILTRHSLQVIVLAI